MTDDDYEAVFVQVTAGGRKYPKAVIPKKLRRKVSVEGVV